MLDRVDRFVTGLSLTAASLALLAAFCIGAMQVLSRFVLEIPTTWSESALRVALIWCVFAAMPVAIRRGALLSVDFLDRKTRNTRYEVYLRGLVAFCTAALLLVLVIAGYRITSRLAFQSIPGLGISVAWAYAVIPGAALLSLVSLVGSIRRPERPDVDIQQ